MTYTFQSRRKGNVLTRSACYRYGVLLKIEDALVSETAPADGWVEGQLHSSHFKSF